MAAEQARNLSLDGLRQKRARAVAQNLGQRIGKSSWLRELENISVGHGVSLLCWRSGGLEHPHDTPPHPFTPSPTFAHSSSANDRGHNQICRCELFCSDSGRTKGVTVRLNRYAIAKRSVFISKLAEPEPIRVSVVSLRNMSGERKYHASTCNPARRIAEA